MKQAPRYKLVMSIISQSVCMCLVSVVGQLPISSKTERINSFIAT